MTSAKRPWLEKTYADRKQRTVDLTCQTILHLKRDKQRISLANIVVASRLIDPQQRGISSSAILANTKAREVYEQARSWRPLKTRITRKHVPVSPFELHIKVDRNEDGARRRLKKLSKEELIDRLLMVEHAFAALKQKWLENQYNVLQDMLAENRDPSK